MLSIQSDRMVIHMGSAAASLIREVKFISVSFSCVQLAFEILVVSVIGFRRSRGRRGGSKA